MRTQLSSEAIIAHAPGLTLRLLFKLVTESIGTDAQMARLRAAQHRFASEMLMLVMPLNFVIALVISLAVQGLTWSVSVAAAMASIACTNAACIHYWYKARHARSLRARAWRTHITCFLAAQNAMFSMLLLHALQRHMPQAASLASLLGCLLMVIGALALAPVLRASLLFILVSAAGIFLLIGDQAAVSPSAVLAVVCAVALASLLCAAGFSSTFARQFLATSALDERNQDVGLLLQDFLELKSDWLWRTNADGSFSKLPDIFPLFMNTPAEKLAGQDMTALMNQLILKQSRYTEDGDRLLMLVNLMDLKKPFSDLSFQVAHGDHRAWWSITGKPVHDANGAFDGYRGVITDVSERYEETQEIIHLAHYDSLTGLANRASFLDQIGSAWQKNRITGRTFALLCIDLDHFKQVNDTFGHPAGDALLREAAQRITSVLGPRDIAARLGGDEFAVLHWIEGSTDYVPILASKMIARLQDPFVIDHCPMRIGASIGIAIAPDHGDGADALMRNGDAALYRAKAAGRGNAIVFDASMHDWLQRRRRLEADLRVAVTHGALKLAYQPVIDTVQRTVVSCEALLRWQHPELGWVPPSEFVPIAEETGLILGIGEWVLREACRAALQWPAGVSVAVNLSPHQLQAGTLLAVIRRALAETGLEPRRLELEVTESVVLDSNRTVIETMHALHDMGIRIALDDFGTGYSSLVYLRHFPFDRIKIDRSFVIDALESSASAAIVETVVHLARRLEIGLTAEGVETMAQYDLMRRLGASCIQGYLFSRPMLEAELQLWFETHRQSSPLLDEGMLRRAC